MQKDEISEDLIKNQTGKKKTPLILCIALAIIAIAAVVIVVVIQANSPQRKYRKLLDQGREFLSELEYEKAIASIDEVLRIDPKNEEALELKAEIYLAWAKAEEEAGNHEEALKLAEEGYDSTEDRQLKKLLEKLSKASETAKGVDEKNDEGTRETDGPDTTEEEDTFQIYLSYLTSEKLDEGVALYQNQIQKNPKDTMAYCFGAALYLVDDDAVSALTVLEAGIAAGADKDILLRREAYVRENTILAAAYKTSTGSYRDDPEDTSSWYTLYDDTGKEIRVETSYGRTDIYDYNEHGDVIHEISKLNGEILSEIKYDYQYNERGDITLITTGAMERRFEYDYDQVGRKIHVRETQTNYSVDSYYEYDANGNVIHERQESCSEYGDIEYRDICESYFTYDENGRLVSRLCEGDGWGPYEGTSTYKYDQRGNQIMSDTPSGITYTTYDLMDHSITENYESMIAYNETNIQNIYKFKGDLEQMLR